VKHFQFPGAALSKYFEAYLRWDRLTAFASFCQGRGIGLANKVAAYHLQDQGLDTVDANRRLGFGDDERVYGCVPFILKDLGIETVQLMTNNPMKVG